MGSFAIAVGCDELSLARGKGCLPKNKKCGQDKADKADKARVTALMAEKSPDLSKQSKKPQPKAF